MQNTQSQAWFKRSQFSIPGGVNSPVRAFKSVGLNPLFIQSGQGARIKDLDGNEFIDYVGSWGPLILGHANPLVLGAIQKALSHGTSFGAPTAKEAVLAEMIKECVPSIELLRLVNSGTEATMGAIRTARGYTGREKIVKFEGCYHGSVDCLLVKAGSGAMTLGQPDSAGVPAGAAADTLLAQFNDSQSVSELFDEFPQDIAAVILEPVAGNMGMIPPKHGFLQQLRQLCDRHGALLIFDEVMTGFRVALGGAQQLFEVQPDLTTLGKVIGGGMPVGAYGGRQDIMESLAPLGGVYQAGTLSGNPIAVAAGIATLKELQKDKTYHELGQKSAYLVNEIQSACQKLGIAVQVHQMGGMFGFFLNENPVHNFQDASSSDLNLFKKLFKSLLTQGVYIAPSAFESLFVSTVHSEADLEQTVKAFSHALQEALATDS